MEITVPHELRQILANLEMMSQVDAVNLAPSPRNADEDVGGKRPPGGIDRKGDREPDYPQKSADHFHRRLNGARTQPQVDAILTDAEQALNAWRNQAVPKDPEYGSPQWKKYVAASTLTHGELAKRFNVKRSYIQQIRREYGAPLDRGVK